MIVSLETHRFQTLKQLREFVSSSGEASFRHTDRASAYAFCRRTLVQFRYSYTSLRRRDKGTVRSDLAKNVSLPRFRGHFILGGRRYPRWQDQDPGTRQSTGARWWIWSGPGVARTTAVPQTSA